MARRMMVTGEVEMGRSYYLMDMEFQFGKIKRSGDR